MTFQRIFMLGILSFVFIGLGSCANVRNYVGLGKTSPNALRVIKHDPMAVPPDLELRPPSETQAIAAVRAGEEPAPSANENLSAGETALLQGAETSANDPAIRESLERLATQEEEEKEKGFFASLFSNDEEESESMPADGEAGDAEQESSDSAQ